MCEELFQALSALHIRAPVVIEHFTVIDHQTQVIVEHFFGFVVVSFPNSLFNGRQIDWILHDISVAL